MADPNRLQSLIQAGSTCIWITTDDEEFALRTVKDAAMGLKRAVLQWDVVRGITDGLVGPGRRPVDKDTEHPAAALYRLGDHQEPALFIMCDLIAHLSDDRTLRAARDLIAKLDLAAESGHSAGCLVLVDHRDDLPPVLRSSATRFELSPPTDKETEALVICTLRRLHQQSPIELAISKKDTAAIVRNLRGLSRRQIEQPIGAAVTDDHRFSADDLAGILARKRQLVQSDGLLEFIQAPTDMSQIGGLTRLKAWLKQREQSLSDDALKFGLPAPRGVLMLGVQGAGKSLCAKSIATAWKRPLLRMDPGVLYDRYIGESERRLRDALAQAQMMAPVVLWIDEIEKAFASAASRSIDGGLSQRMFGTLLTWLQEHTEPVFVAATANDVEALPPELLRKGRFDEIFFVDLPGPDARAEIFRIHLARRSRTPGEFRIDDLVAASEGFSGAEIEQAVIAALHTAFSGKSDLDTDMILAALRGSPPLSATMAEKVQDLRAWAKGRCVPAD